MIFYYLNCLMSHKCVALVLAGLKHLWVLISKLLQIKYKIFISGIVFVNSMLSIFTQTIITVFIYGASYQLSSTRGLY